MISSVKDNELVSPFRILMPLGHFSCLIERARTFSTMLTLSSWAAFFSLVFMPYTSNVSPLSWHGILMITILYQVMEISFHFWCVKSFIMNACWFLSTFLYSLSLPYSLSSVNIVSHLNKFANQLLMILSWSLVDSACQYRNWSILVTEAAIIFSHKLSLWVAFPPPCLTVFLLYHPWELKFFSFCFTEQFSSLHPLQVSQ